MKPRVLHITPSFLPAFGGMENCVLNVALRHAAEWDVHILANYRAQAMHGAAYDVHHFLPFTFPLLDNHPRLGGLFVALQLLAMQRRHRFDLWHAHFTDHFGQIQVEAAMRCRVPCLWAVHEFSCVRNLKAYFDRRRHVTDRLPPNRLIVEVGAGHLAEQIAALSRVRCVHVPRGCNHDLFRDTPPSPDGRRYGFNLIAMARNIPDKRLALSIRLVDHLVKAGHTDVGLTIITHDTRSLAALVDQFGLRERVRLLRSADLQRGARFVIPPLGAIAELKAADCLVSMHRYEASPNVLIEAFAAGLPVLVCDTAEYRQLVTDGQNGFIAKSDDPKDLAEPVLKLMRDAELRRRMADNAEQAGRAFDWEKSARRYAELYREALASRV